MRYAHPSSAISLLHPLPQPSLKPLDYPISETGTKKSYLLALCPSLILLTTLHFVNFCQFYPHRQFRQSNDHNSGSIWEALLLSLWHHFYICHHCCMAATIRGPWAPYLLVEMKYLLLPFTVYILLHYDSQIDKHFTNLNNVSMTLIHDVGKLHSITK